MSVQNCRVAIELPPKIGTDDIPSLMEVCAQIKQGTGHVTLDCSKVVFCDPFGMSVLAAALETIDRSRPIRMDWLSVKIAGYLDRMDFFNRIDVDGVELPPNQRHDQRCSLLELTKITDPRSSEEIAEGLVTAVVGEIVGRQAKPVDFNNPDIEFSQYYDPIRYALSELVENSLTHARRQGRSNASVWIASQYYRSTDTVHLAVVDDGCGLLATLRNHPDLPEKTHQAATLLALQPRISCNRGVCPLAPSENQGVGLTTTTKISKAADGKVHIVSGDSLYAAPQAAGLKRSDRVKSLGEVWDGVAISATFIRAKLPDIKISELLPQEDFVLSSEASNLGLRFID